MKGWTLIFTRSIILFFVTLILVRIMGKRYSFNSTAFNMVNYAVIGIIAALTSVNIINNFIYGITALLVWTLIPIALGYLSLVNPKVHTSLNGKETVIIENGKVMEESLKKAGLAPEDLLRRLRIKNAFNLADVEFAVLEPTGELNVLLKSEKQPVTAKDLKLNIPPQAEPQTVILDGNILDESLIKIGFNREWLTTQLQNSNVTLENVFIAQVNSSGELYLDLFDDLIPLPQPQVRELVYASLEKSHADLMSFSLDTVNKEAKIMYSGNADKIKKIMGKLEPFLLH